MNDWDATDKEACAIPEDAAAAHRSDAGIAQSRRTSRACGTDRPHRRRQERGAEVLTVEA